MHDECTDSDESSEYCSSESSEQDGQAANSEAVALNEQEHFKALAVKAGEPQQSESPEDAFFAAVTSALVEKIFLPAVVQRNPAGPVGAVKKPIHHEQQDQDREESGGRLQSKGETRISRSSRTPTAIRQAISVATNPSATPKATAR